MDSKNEYIQHKCIIEEDKDFQSVSAFRFNCYDRAPSLMSSEESSLFYHHLKVLHQEMRNGDLEFWLQLEPGTILVINNQRVMHGRREFSLESPRELAGMYINKEDFQSRLRVVSKNVKSKQE
eukprot:Platyproteum_vivax@DN5173_c0_g1_i5.p1